jgi:leucyl aminopeptidase
MMIEMKLTSKKPARSELHTIAVCSDQLDSIDIGVDKKTLKLTGFEATAGQIAITQSSEGPCGLIGMGTSDDVTDTTFRQAGTVLARSTKGFKQISVDFSSLLVEGVSALSATQALVEGVYLGAYEYTKLKSDPKPTKLQLVSIVGSGRKMSNGLDRGKSTSRGVNLARDLVNQPGGELTPAVFARIATKIAKEHRLSIKVLDAPAIKKAKMGGLLGVNRGSTQQPRFVQLTYRPTKPSKKHLALVGKGITFDAGGLSIKTAQGMSTMKCDMGGAAAVLGTMSVLSELSFPTRVTGYIPLTDNMLGGDATRPGDVLKIRNGKTVEVLNTDAEGRLVLADALSLASESKPNGIIDLATLTGACMVALGNEYAGLMGTDSDLIDQLKEASEATGEDIWQLPLPVSYRAQLDSDVADMKNIGGSYGGAITAGLFLKEFVAEGIPWAHIDIAGPAFADSPWGNHPKGATGYGVRLLLNFIENYD